MFKRGRPTTWDGRFLADRSQFGGGTKAFRGSLDGVDFGAIEANSPGRRWGRLTIRRTVFYDAIGLEARAADVGGAEGTGFNQERPDGD
jgi:hypothetical protein